MFLLPVLSSADELAMSPLDLKGSLLVLGLVHVPPSAAPGWTSGARETGAGGAGDVLGAELMIWT